MLALLAEHQFTLIGVIFMLVIGPAVGNYACSVVYRLPRGKTPFERHPYCGHCNADLKPIDLFPIVSWCLTRGKCRYCGGPIPGIYTLIELLCGVCFIAYFLRYGIGELFILYAAFAAFVLIMAAIQWEHGWISSTIYSYALMMVIIVRTLHESTILGMVQGGFLMLVLALLIDRLCDRKGASPFEKPWIWWWVLLGALVPIASWKIILPALCVAMLIPKPWRVVVYAGMALAVPMLAGIS